MLKEAEWSKDKSVPTMHEYITNAYVSFALGPNVLPALYFVGPKLSGEAVGHPEFHDLFRLMSTCGRLLNDIQTFKVRCSVSSSQSPITIFPHEVCFKGY